jgi:hypothetical protein
MKAVILRLNCVPEWDYGRGLTFAVAESIKNKTSWTILGEEFFSCREMFQDYFDCFLSRRNGRRKNALVISHPGIDRNNIYQFILEIEKKLKIKDNSKMFIALAGKYCKNISLIMPSSFWLKNELVFSLFTIILRASVLYKSGMDCMSVLLKQKYAQKTKPVIDRFFNGYTKIKNKKDSRCMWMDMFETCQMKEKCYTDTFDCGGKEEHIFVRR